MLPGQYNVSDEEYNRIVTQHVTELWTNYGPMTEIWIDSPLQTPQHTETNTTTDPYTYTDFVELMERLQPNAAGTPRRNPREWCGTESGHPSRDVGPGPIWQTGTGSHGDPTAMQWVDKFCDPQLFQQPSLWFWEPHQPIRALTDLIPIYHDIVGRGMIMELAVAITREGVIAAEHATVYQQLGDWVRTCYGQPVVEAALAAARVVAASSPPQHDIVRLVLPPGSEFDRIMISEDISFGQRIRNYTVSIIIEDTNLLSSSSSTSTIVLVSNGTSVGRKRIHVFPKIYSTIASTIQEEEERQQQYQHLSESSKISTTVTVLMNITKSIATPQLKLLGLYGPCFPRRNDENNNDKDIIILSKTRTTSTISTT